MVSVTFWGYTVTKIVNCHVPGCWGYAGPVGGGRGSKRNFCERVKLKAAQFTGLGVSHLFQSPLFTPPPLQVA
jgi:hypothetical protein